MCLYPKLILNRKYLPNKKNEKDRNALIWADKRFKEAAADMQEASTKLASGQNAKIEYEISQIKKRLDKMDLDMKGIELDNYQKRKSKQPNDDN